MRAVRGVGALIWDFLGVSVSLDLLARLDAVDRRALAVVDEDVEHFQAFSSGNKGVSHRVLGLDAALGVPHETFRDKINEKLIVAAENLGKGLCAWPSSAPLRVHHWPRGASGV
jgi:hypothetical protein